jgi:predicted DNA-binding transcriptional regulator AlpA
MTSPTCPAHNATPNRLLSIPELADYLGVPVATI